MPTVTKVLGEVVPGSKGLTTSPAYTSLGRARMRLWLLGRLNGRLNSMLNGGLNSSLLARPMTSLNS
jgi:hypothetical protein